MFIVLGLIILVAAVVVGVAGVLTNHDAAHALTERFAVFGYHVHGSTGRLFLYGIVVGAAALFGLGMLLTGARHTSRRGRAARLGLRQSRGETAAVERDRDNLIEQRKAARGQSTTVVRSGPGGNGDADPPAGRRSLLHRLGNRAPARQAAPATPPVSADAPVDG